MFWILEFWLLWVLQILSLLVGDSSPVGLYPLITGSILVVAPNNCHSLQLSHNPFAEPSKNRFFSAGFSVFCMLVGHVGNHRINIQSGKVIRLVILITHGGTSTIIPGNHPIIKYRAASGSLQISPCLASSSLGSSSSMKTGVYFDGFFDLFRSNPGFSPTFGTASFPSQNRHWSENQNLHKIIVRTYGGPGASL